MISVCIITKNQSALLNECLSRLSKEECEIVVCDSGSDDDSVEVAHRYTDKVFHFKWIDDFSAAKNFCVEKASNDLVLIVDTDEFLSDGSLADLYEMMIKNPDAIGSIKIISEFSQNKEIRQQSDFIPRAFDRRLYHFVGRIHEQIEKKDKSKSKHYRTSLSFLHEGYNLSGEEKRKKALRNINLLKEELEKKLEDFSTNNHLNLDEQNELGYLYYQLGKGYYFLGDYETAYSYFKSGLEYDLNEALEYVSDMVETYGYVLINTGRFEEAALLESVYDSFKNSADFCFLMGLIYMNNARFNDAIGEFEKAASFKDSKIAGVNSYLAYYNCGVIMECLGETDKALTHYKKCKNYDKALLRIKDLS